MKYLKNASLLFLLITLPLSVFSQDEDERNKVEKSIDSLAIQSAKIYIATYNEPDIYKKDEMISKSFHEKGIVVTPTRELNKNGLEEMVANFHKEYEMEILGDIKVHHNYITFKWKYSELNGNSSWTGIDFCEFGKDGRLTKVIIFFD